MKIINVYITLFLSLFLLLSCEEGSNMDPIGQWELTSPDLQSPAADATIVLDEDNPVEKIRFDWGKAVSSANYNVRYAFVLDSAGNSDFNSPILKLTSGNGGKDTFVEPTFQQIDQALSIAGYEAGSIVELQWAVIARSIDKTTMESREVLVKRFLTEAAPVQLYVSGTATEAGSNVEEAIPMRAIRDADDNLTNIFELYTGLRSDGTFMFYSQPTAKSLKYGGEAGVLQKSGTELSVAEDSPYRITVNFNTKTYELLKIDKLSVVGNVVPGGWGGDEPLVYRGNSIWTSSLYLDYGEDASGNFVFRLNGDWGYLLKRVKGTTNRLVMESQAGLYGVEFEDVPLNNVPGQYFVTVNLAAAKYDYSIEKDDNVTPPAETPDALFLLNSEGDVITEFTKNEDKFASDVYLALQSNQSYTLNSKSDGSGTAYSINESLGVSDNPDGDKVSGNIDFGEGGTSFSVSRDQMYQIPVNFGTAKVSWTYYNIKLFHWDEVNQGWDNRDEFLMTYEHPYTFKLTAPLVAGYDMKFNSPWDIQFGADDPAALSGTMTNNGGSNFRNITSGGNYEVTIVVANDYSTGSYEFVKK